MNAQQPHPDTTINSPIQRELIARIHLWETLTSLAKTCIKFLDLVIKDKFQS